MLEETKKREEKGERNGNSAGYGPATEVPLLPFHNPTSHSPTSPQGSNTMSSSPNNAAAASSSEEMSEFEKATLNVAELLRKEQEKKDKKKRGAAAAAAAAEDPKAKKPKEDKAKASLDALEIPKVSHRKQ